METKFRYALVLEIAIERGWGSRDIDDSCYILETNHHIDGKIVEAYAQVAEEQIIAHKSKSNGSKALSNTGFPYNEDDYMIDRLAKGIAYCANGTIVDYTEAVYPVQLDGIIMYHHTFEEGTV